MSFRCVNRRVTGKIDRALMRAFAGILFLLAFDAASGNDFTFGKVKTALVIGNGAYRQAPLKNPVNDAQAVASALKLLGFHVIQRENATQREMLEALREFSHQSARSQVRLLFYAGHGVQIKGRNYLMPVDAEVQSEDDIAQRGADLSEVLERLAAVKGGINLVILDACRNNPFNLAPAQLADARGYRTRAIGAAATNGLAPVQAPSGTLVAFSTAPGSISIDNAMHGNSVYTKHLLAYLNIPGLPVERLFKQVRSAVAQETRQQQVPWESSSLMGEFCFRPDAAGGCNG
jgi:carboxyl-terminal processing protease